MMIVDAFIDMDDDSGHLWRGALPELRRGGGPRHRPQPGDAPG